MKTEIKNNGDAVNVLYGMERCLDEISVSGRNSCLMIVALANDIESLKKYLTGGEAGER